ncbi:hypothetical protein KIL84_020076, partial [Mauremys mutica]
MFQLSLAYLVDIFESLNNLNLKLQENNKQHCKHYSAPHCYKNIYRKKSSLGNVERKLRCLIFRLYQHFYHSLKLCKEDAKNKIVFHLDCLADEFICYFPDNFSGNPVQKLARNLFKVDVDSLPEILQEKALKMKYNS